MLAQLEPIAERGRKQAGAGRSADQRERLERHIDGSRVDALAKRQVDPKIFHRGIEKFLDGFRQTVNFVDKQDGPLLGIGQIGDHILGCCQGRPAGDLKVDAQIAGNAHGKRRFTQAGRAVEKDVAQGFAAFGSSIHRNFKPGVDVPLPDHVAHPLRAQIAVVVAIVRRGLQDRFAGHNKTVYKREGRGARGGDAACPHIGEIDDIPLDWYTFNMISDADKIVSEALALPPAVRAFVAEKLIESLDAIPGGKLSPPWQEEVRRRCQEVAQGAIELQKAEAVFAKAYAAIQ